MNAVCRTASPIQTIVDNIHIPSFRVAIPYYATTDMRVARGHHTTSLSATAASKLSSPTEVAGRHTESNVV